MKNYYINCYKWSFLTPREINILNARWGLKYQMDTSRWYSGLTVEGKSLAEVGKMNNLSRERIRQIEFKAIRKLQKILRCTTDVDN